MLTARRRNASYRPALVQQESEIGGRLMGCSDGQEHVLLVREVAVQYIEQSPSAPP
jgi:hypothetical protein